MVILMKITEPTKVCANPDCPNQGQRQPWSNFYPKRKWPDGTMRQPHSRCSICMKANAAERKRRKRAQMTPEQRREFDRARYAELRANPERRAARIEAGRQWHEKNRRARGVSKRPFRFRDRPDVREELSAAPFADWLRGVMAREDDGIVITAERLGMSDRNLRRILDGQTVVELSTVERALIADDTVPLFELYPDWFEEAA